MKKIIYSFLLICFMQFGSQSIYAQGQQDMNAVKNSQIMTDFKNGISNLTANQISKLENLAARYATNLEQVTKTANGDAKVELAKLKELNEKVGTELKTFLSESQLDQLTQIFDSKYNPVKSLERKEQVDNTMATLDAVMKLSAEQKTKIRPILVKYGQQQEEAYAVMKKDKMNANGTMEKLQQLDYQMRSDIADHLTKTQQDAWLVYESKMSKANSKK